MTNPMADPVLTRFARRSPNSTATGSRAVLFGSRARGDAQKDSDYDVAVFLNDRPDRWQELDRLAALRLKFLDETGAFFDAMPYATGTHHDPRMPLMHEIRREGLDLRNRGPKRLWKRRMSC